MQKITLKDNHFRIIAYVDIAPNGDKALQNEKFQILGLWPYAEGHSRIPSVLIK